MMPNWAHTSTVSFASKLAMPTEREVWTQYYATKYVGHTCLDMQVILAQQGRLSLLLQEQGGQIV